jgi:hypothetical protein
MAQPAKFGDVTASNTRQLRNLRRRIRKEVKKDLLQEERKENTPVASNMSEFTLESLFDGEVLKFAECVVNPFSDGAIGAIIPDKWNPPTIPAMDRISMILNPAVYEAFAQTTINGFIICLLPRSLAAGWLALDSGGLAPLWPHYPIGDDLVTDVLDDPVASAYCLVIAGIGILAGDSKFIALDPNSSADKVKESKIFNVKPVGPDGKKKVKLLSSADGFNSIPFARFGSLDSNASGLRICGGGLKILANEAPINTGGTVYGGWMPIVDLFQSNATTIEDIGGFAPELIQDALRYRKVFRGVEGITVRYSPLQSPKQEEFQPTNETAMFDQDGVFNLNVSFGVHDLISTSDYIPCVVWKFNQPVLGAAETYSLRVESRVHVQAEPDGSCPFMTLVYEPEITFRQLPFILNNVDLFPIVAKGASFSSFIGKIGSFVDGTGKVINTVGKGVGSLGKFIKMIQHLQ